MTGQAKGCKDEVSKGHGFNRAVMKSLKGHGVPQEEI